MLSRSMKKETKQVSAVFYIAWLLLAVSRQQRMSAPAVGDGVEWTGRDRKSMMHGAWEGASIALFALLCMSCDSMVSEGARNTLSSAYEGVAIFDGNCSALRLVN